MKKVRVYEIIGKTEKDNEKILEMDAKRIEMNIDEYGRIFSEGGIYIADGKVVEAGFGIGCR